MIQSHGGSQPVPGPRGSRAHGEIGVDRGVLAGTLAGYNTAARAGQDLRFSRSADTLVPLDTGRLYAIETWPGVAGTTGGPRHDERARVVRPGGQPIPGLYAARAADDVTRAADAAQAARQ